MIRRRALLILALSLAASCGKNGLPSQPASGNTRVRVFNDSPYTLTNVHITTANGVEFLVTTLGAGNVSSEHAVTELHATPAVSLIAAGETLALIPAEGFDGFNAKLADGSYLLTLTVKLAPASLRIELSQPVE